MIYKIKNRLNYIYKPLKLKRLRKSVESILNRQELPDTDRSERAFEELQRSFPSDRGELYKYDDLSLFSRAFERAIAILQLPGMAEPGKKVLDVGAGDGVLGVILSTFGHIVDLADEADWRSRMAKAINLQTCDITDGLPFEDCHFDLVVSYNSFEHFPDPTKAFAEAMRVSKQGGLLHFEFGPLFASSWGLHAYRSLFMPYAQFLFSDNFINDRLNELGIEDLGSKRSKLQYVNKWRFSDCEKLWQHERCDLLECKWGEDSANLQLVEQFPEAFQGRGLKVVDLIRSSSFVTLRING